MYSVNLEVSETKGIDTTNLRVSVDDSLFLKYLEETLLLFPVYISFEKRIFRLPEVLIESIPTENKVLLNTLFEIQLPKLKRERDYAEFKRQIAVTVMDWLDEQHSIYRKQWKSNFIQKSYISI